MCKHVLLLALSGVIALFSCTNTPTTAQPGAPATGEAASKSSAPDPNDLLKTLQGTWISETDSTYFLEITDTQMQHINNGKVSQQSMIDVDGACESPVCKPDGVDTSDGWCFTEMTVTENGKYAAQCNFVTACDKGKLQYRSLSGTGASLSFKKIR
jgi:hypothetical protein